MKTAKTNGAGNMKTKFLYASRLKRYTDYIEADARFMDLDDSYEFSEVAARVYETTQNLTVIQIKQIAVQCFGATKIPGQRNKAVEALVSAFALWRKQGGKLESDFFRRMDEDT